MSKTRAILFRIALGATALSLWAYIPYRYATRPPGFEGFLGAGYAVLFPLAGLLALGALVAAWRPALVERLTDRGASRTLLGAYSAVWLAMGLLCVPSLQATSAVAPLKGALATIHMTAQHVFLGLAAVGAAWRPEVAASILLARPVTAEGKDEVARLEEPASG
ncbi:MAG: hypothetical protein KY397_03480 [Gemmatimonadetes bacterium]|nr:hypothetical protein [Gemmatimonadota bacterium]